MLMPILLGLGATLFTMAGGLVAMRVHDRRHILLGAAGGVVLGVVAFDLLPESIELSTTHVGSIPAAMVMFVLGFLSIHLVEKALELHRENSHHYRAHSHDLRPLGLLAGGALVAHSFLDGLGIGVSWGASSAVGLSVAMAVLVHDFADGFNTFTLTSIYGNDRRRALTLLVCDAVAPVVGAALGSLIHLPDAAMALYLGYFAGFLMHIATSTILPEAHADHPSWGTLAATVGGVVVIGAAISALH